MTEQTSEYQSVAEERIYEALQNLDGPSKITGTSVMICCPFHSDSTPSCGINISGDTGIPFGYFHCLGCGEKGHWNKIAEKLGLPLLKRGDFKITSYRQKNREQFLAKERSLKDIITKDFKCSQMYSRWKEDTNWRTIKGRLLNKLAFNIFDVERGAQFVLLPVYVDNELRGSVKALMNKSVEKKESSYYTSKGTWIKSYGLFPYDYVHELIKERGYNCVVLCEGPRDCLKLLQYGIPALAILGAKTWTAKKRNLILGLPINKVIILMDGDNAGRSAARTIKEDLKNKIEVVDINLRKLAKTLELDELDPATLPISHIKKLKRYVVSLITEQHES